MYLYNLTLHDPPSITHAILGHFSGTKHQEILISRNTYLELWTPNPEIGKLTKSSTSQNTFSRIRALAPFRLTGSGTKDQIIVGTDSGCITVLEYNPKTRGFDVVLQQTFGRSGMRRLVPGEYLATDPRGRAIMIGSIEKQKFVYIFNRDAEANLVMSSPLEAHKGQTLLRCRGGRCWIRESGFCEFRSLLFWNWF